MTEEQPENEEERQFWENLKENEFNYHFFTQLTKFTNNIKKNQIPESVFNIFINTKSGRSDQLFMEMNTEEKDQIHLGKEIISLNCSSTQTFASYRKSEIESYYFQELNKEENR